MCAKSERTCVCGLCCCRLAVNAVGAVSCAHQHNHGPPQPASLELLTDPPTHTHVTWETGVHFPVVAPKVGLEPTTTGLRVPYYPIPTLTHRPVGRLMNRQCTGAAAAAASARKSVRCDGSRLHLQHMHVQ